MATRAFAGVVEPNCRVFEFHNLFIASSSTFPPSGQATPTLPSVALAERLPIMDRWIERPYLFAFPAIGAIAAIALGASIRRHNDRWPFYMVALIFVTAFGTLALSFWPYMIPFVVTVDEAAAPHSSLAFMFWGGLVVFPLMLLYTIVSYSVFKGKSGATIPAKQNRHFREE